MLRPLGCQLNKNDKIQDFFQSEFLYDKICLKTSPRAILIVYLHVKTTRLPDSQNDKIKNFSESDFYCFYIFKRTRYVLKTSIKAVLIAFTNFYNFKSVGRCAAGPSNSKKG
jgi:hypothetical protein